MVVKWCLCQRHIGWNFYDVVKCGLRDMKHATAVQLQCHLLPHLLTAPGTSLGVNSNALSNGSQKSFAIMHLSMSLRLVSLNQQVKVNTGHEQVAINIDRTI